MRDLVLNHIGMKGEDKYILYVCYVMLRYVTLCYVMLCYTCMHVVT